MRYRSILCLSSSMILRSASTEGSGGVAALTTATPEPKESTLEQTLDKLAQLATVAASVTGNPVAGGVAAALGVADHVAEDVGAGQVAHATNVSLATTAINDVVTSADTVTAIKALPAEAQAKATGILAFMKAGWAEFESLF